ncbi:unnamed protein product [Penicillium bialowiezense]
MSSSKITCTQMNHPTAMDLPERTLPHTHCMMIYVDIDGEIKIEESASMQEKNPTAYAPEHRRRIHEALREHIRSHSPRSTTAPQTKTESGITLVPTRPTCAEPPINYDARWTVPLQSSPRRLAAILGMADTSGLWAIWFENNDAQNLLRGWAKGGPKGTHSARGAKFASMWGLLEPSREAMQSPNRPELGDNTFNEKGVGYKCTLKLWYLYRLMQAVPELHSKSDLEAFRIDAYDLYKADRVLAFFERRCGERQFGVKPPKTAPALEILWHREPPSGETIKQDDLGIAGLAIDDNEEKVTEKPTRKRKRQNLKRT